MNGPLTILESAQNKVLMNRKDCYRAFKVSDFFYDLSTKIHQFKTDESKLQEQNPLRMKALRLGRSKNGKLKTYTHQ